MIITTTRGARLLCGAILLLVIAQSNLEAQPRSDREFNAFWIRFRTAMIKNDKEAIASMTRFPFLYDSKERSRAGFMAIQIKLFTRRVRKCFATAKPLKEGDVYDVFCDGIIFYFGKSDSEYRFLEFGPDD